MPRKSLSSIGSIGLAIGLVVYAGAVAGPLSSQTSTDTIAIDNNDLAGRVTGPSGPEAGVWVSS
jgi:hypothetical protein